MEIAIKRWPAFDKTIFMIKKTLVITLIVLNIFICSCSSEDAAEPAGYKLVKTEKISDTRKVETTYNSHGLISNLTGKYNGFTYVSEFSYDSTDKLIQWDYQETGSSSYSDKYVYNYDSYGYLTNYTANNENVNLAYHGKIITVTGTIEGNSGSEAELALNSNGMVIRLTKANQYSTFEYDDNGNLLTVKSYDNSDHLLLDYTLSYDDKINPFYGQLESIYIERFIEFFWEFDGQFLSGFEGYGFPFLKNNITSIIKTGAESTTYTYVYDSENYPTHVIGETSGEAITYEIEYYE